MRTPPHILRAFLALLVAAALPATAQTNPQPRHILIFRSGDLLYGTLHSIKPAEGLRWTHPDVAAPILFALTNFSEVHLGSPPQPVSRPPNFCHVKLVNDDELSGGLVSLDADALVLDTWYAGRVTLPRARVKSFTPVPAPAAVIYDGPTGLDGWTLGKVQGIPDSGQWRFVNGAFIATQSASIARDLKLPERMSLEFEMAWRGTFNLAVALYTDSLQPISLRAKENEPDFGNFYSLQMNNPVLSLLYVSKLEPLAQLGQSIISAFSQTNRAHVVIKVDKPQNLIALYADGALLKSWSDPDGFRAKGTGVRIVHQGVGAIRLSNIRVTEWDGHLETPAPAAVNPKQDLARLVNMDTVAGELLAFRDGKLRFNTGATSVEIPLTRVAQVDFAAEKLQPVAKQPNDVRLYFAQRGSVTLELESWDAQRVAGTSRVFGKVELKPEAFSRVQFAAP